MDYGFGCVSTTTRVFRYQSQERVRILQTRQDHLNRLVNLSRSSSARHDLEKGTPEEPEVHVGFVWSISTGNAVVLRMTSSCLLFNHNMEDKVTPTTAVNC